MTPTTAAAFVGAAGGTSYSGVTRLVQWCVIALVFIFFLRVIRAVWVEVRPAGPRQGRRERAQAAETAQEAAAGQPPRRRRGSLVLEVVEPAERAGQTYAVDGDMTVGRSPGCAISTGYDIYSSTMHARFFLQNGRLYVEDLGSTNGTFVNSERITKPVKLGRGDLVQVGATVFEVSR